MALLESQQVARLVVRLALDPAAVEDCDPLEGERAQGSLVTHAAGAAALVESLCPEERGTVWPTHSMKVWRRKVGHE